MKCVEVMDGRLCRGQWVRLQAKQMEAVSLLISSEEQHACRVKAKCHNGRGLMGTEVSYDATGVAGCQAQLTTSNHLWRRVE